MILNRQDAKAAKKGAFFEIIPGVLAVNFFVRDPI
jgi:hypothetical protein